jgi:hypothetical protein
MVNSSGDSMHPSDVQVPMTIIRHRDAPLNNTTPTILRVYLFVYRVCFDLNLMVLCCRYGSYGVVDTLQFEPQQVIRII